MTNLDSIFKSRDITLPTKGRLRSTGIAFPGPFLPKDLQPHCHKNLKQGSRQDVVVCTHLSKINVCQDSGGPAALGPRKTVIRWP